MVASVVRSIAIKVANPLMVRGPRLASLDYDALGGHHNIFAGSDKERGARQALLGLTTRSICSYVRLTGNSTMRSQTYRAIQVSEPKQLELVQRAVNFKLDRLTKPDLQQTLVCYRCFRDLRIRARYGCDLDDEQHQSFDFAPIPDVDSSHTSVFPIYCAGGSSC